MTLEEAIAQIRADPNRPRDATEEEIEHWARCAMAISSAVSAPLREEIDRLDPPYVAALKVRVSKAAITLRDALGLAEFPGPGEPSGIDDLAALAAARMHCVPGVPHTRCIVCFEAGREHEREIYWTGGLAGGEGG